MNNKNNIIVFYTFKILIISCLQFWRENSLFDIKPAIKAPYKFKNIVMKVELRTKK